MSMQSRRRSVDIFRALAVQELCTPSCRFLCRRLPKDRRRRTAKKGGNGVGQDRPRRHPPRGKAGLHKVWHGTAGSNFGTAISCSAAPMLARRRAAYAGVRCSTLEYDPWLSMTRIAFGLGRGRRDRASWVRDALSVACYHRAEGRRKYSSNRERDAPSNPVHT